jgi:hypothetical protein
VRAAIAASGAARLVKPPGRPPVGQVLALGAMPADMEARARGRPGDHACARGPGAERGWTAPAARRGPRQAWYPPGARDRLGPSARRSRGRGRTDRPARGEARAVRSAFRRRRCPDRSFAPPGRQVRHPPSGPIRSRRSPDRRTPSPARYEI